MVIENYLDWSLCILEPSKWQKIETVSLNNPDFPLVRLSGPLDHKSRQLAISEPGELSGIRRRGIPRPQEVGLLSDHAAKGSVFVNLINTGNFKIRPT